MAEPKRTEPTIPRTDALDLVATTAHELKSPLTLISGLAAMLEAEQFGQVSDQQRQYLSRIMSTSERLMTIVDGLLTINRSQHQRLSLNLEPVVLKGLINEVIDELDPQLKSRQMAIKWLASKKLPPVIADRGCLYQIVFNLLDNAIKYSPASTTITIKVKLRGDQLLIQVSDQGIGIKPSEIEKLFERFGKTGQPLSAHAGSTGLGLFIVKSLVELQGGSITATSLNRGTCFTVTLPVAQQLALFMQG